MLTRHGYVAIVVGVIAAVIGRVFGVVELFVIGAGFVLAAALAVVLVRVRHPPVRAARWIHPSLLTAGETGRVDLKLEHDGSLPSTTFDVAESIHHPGQPARQMRLVVDSMRARSTTSMRYSLPTAMRGVVELGPLAVENRDLLGLAMRRSVVAGAEHIVVVPRTHLLDMPQLGRGPLGRQLIDRARRLGPGEFHSLRDYADGDEPRSINWRASARTDDLKVTQRTTEGLDRCIVVFDCAATSYADRDGFERGVSVAASLVHSAAHAGLTTRFLSSAGLDLRGPEVAPSTLRHLAVIVPDEERAFVPERDPSEGLGLVLAITGSSTAALVRSLEALSDPTVTIVPVTTDRAAAGRLAVGARTEREFIQGWQRLTGAAGSTFRPVPAPLVGAGAGT